MAEADRFDIVIAGGGPVGCVLGRALAGSGLAVLQIRDSRSAEDRPIALSLGSREILERLGLWSGIAATPILSIHVSQRGAFGRTLIGAGDCGVPALGYVVSYRDLLSPIARSASGTGVQGRLVSWSVEPEAIRARYADEHAERNCSARLLVLADGNDAADEARDYGQSAIVAQVRCERAHRNVAWERFTPEGPLALLPHGESYALIWSTAQAAAKALIELADDAFVEALQQAFGWRLGRFLAAGPRAAFPLALRYSRMPPAARVIPAGNAAQTLHPVAGQGLNLGLRDAAELAEQVLATAPADLGGREFMRRYWRRRSLDRNASVRFTDLLVRLFSNSRPSLAMLRGAGLVFFDVVPPARRFLARRMMFGARALP